MKILKLLNSNYLSILIIALLIIFIPQAKAEDKPIDIWNINQNNIENQNSTEDTNNSKAIENEVNQTSIYDLQSQKETDIVQVDSSLESKDIDIIGIYDPEDYNHKIDMWSNSNGDQLKYLFSNLAKMELSEDASELMNIAILTNSYYPDNNFEKKEFLKIKSDWLIKNSNMELIEEYLVKNQTLNLQSKLSRYYVDKHLSESNVDKACDIFLKIMK